MRGTVCLLLTLLMLAVNLGAQTAVLRPPPRIRVATCAAADSLLGPASRDVLKSEVHGTVGPDSAFDLRSGGFTLRRSTMREMEGAARLAICQRASAE
ncbi:MAG TPA: hypothetical protein VFO96_10895 [Gemmatimonadales bacterium]|jgi:hypothetical protein|nr:hypothetical protein [Gemmatimonadales bacterium]